MKKNFVSLSAYSFIRKTLVFSTFVVFAFSGIVNCKSAKEKNSTESSTGMHADGRKDEILLNHTYNQSQIDWFKAGGALNVNRREVAAEDVLTEY